TATRTPPPASCEAPSKITVTGSSRAAANASSRSTSRRCAPRRSRHQPSGRAPITLLPSTIHSGTKRTLVASSRMTRLAAAVRTVVQPCLAVKAGETVVVVTDSPLQDVGEALREEAQRAGGDAVLAVMTPRANHGEEPPSPIAEALAASDVFIAPASRSLSHTQARKP